MTKFYDGQYVIHQKDGAKCRIEHVYPMKDGIQEYRISCNGKMKIACEEMLKSAFVASTSFASSHRGLSYGFVQSYIEKYKLYYLFHFTHIDNLSSILSNGLLPKNKLSTYKHITDAEVQVIRSNVTFFLTGNVKVPLHDCVPLYISWRTPTLYKLLHSGNISNEDIVFLLVNTQSILCSDCYNYCFTDGNAASYLTRQYVLLRNLDNLDWATIKADHWGGDPDKVRKKNAEFLVYPKIEPKDFYKIIVFSSSQQTDIEKVVSNSRFNIKVEADERYYEWPRGFRY